MQMTRDYSVRKKRYITLPAKYQKELQKEFDCTTECIRQALNFMSDSEQAEMIRARALEMNGFVAYKAV
jgi:DNA-binding transcriptional regulator/RsmH inhibitor MraZ